MVMILTRFSLSITLSDCHLDASEWVLDTGSTYHMCPKRKLFASFEELDGGLLSMKEDNICRLVGKDTVNIRINDGTNVQNNDNV